MLYLQRFFYKMKLNFTLRVTVITLIVLILYLFANIVLSYFNLIYKLPIVKIFLLIVWSISVISLKLKKNKWKKN